MQIPLYFTLEDPAAGQPVVSMWLAALGEMVQVGEPLVEVLYPGVTTAVKSPVAGQLVAIHKSIDTQLFAGDVLGLIETGEGSQASPPTR